MSYLTPIEISLEHELDNIGMSFRERRLIYNSVQGTYLAKVSSPSARKMQANLRLVKALADSEGNDQLKKSAERMLESFKINWSDFLVYRESSDNSNGLYVVYSVFPTEENEESFRQISNYDDFDKFLDTILRERSFASEEISIRNSRHRLDFDRSVRQNIEVLRGKLDIEDTEILERDATPFYVTIDFTSEGVKKSISPQLPPNLLDGLSDPNNDAYKIANRIATFIKEY